MNIWMEPGRRAAADLWPGLVSHVWLSTIFLLAILVILAVLRRRLTAGARFSLVLIGLAKFALPHALVAVGVQALDKALRIDPRGSLEMPLRVAAAALRIDFVPAGTPLWPAIALGVWAAVALASILRLAWSHHRLASLLARTALPARPREAAALERARQRTGARGRIGIARSPLPEAPAVLGVRRPLILLPLAGCDDLSDDELESLLRHECAHVARRDNLAAGCTAVLGSLLWFHPLVWIARRILRVERERACDEIAVGSGEGKETYLTALAKFCHHAAIGPELPGISRMAAAQLKERMDHIMRYPILKAQSPSPARAALLTATTLAFFTLASGLVGSGPLAFADGQAHNPHIVRMAVTRAGATAEPAGSLRENATRAVIATPVPSLDASRAQDPPEGKAAQRTQESAVATAASGSEANPGTAELASPRSPSNCLSIKCSITCDNGLSYTQDFTDAVSCYSYSDRAGCHSSGFYVCSDKPAATGC
ncbi:MAG TPA: M56 family metallopeptidase [Thermoanaerobaculia bacterium]|jgi:beta-lactamase regulating signal transducer with metallopeptidase domain